MNNIIWILICSNRLNTFENSKIIDYIEKNNFTNIKILDPERIIINMTNQNETEFLYANEKEEIEKLDYPQKVFIKVGMMINEYQINLLKTLKQCNVALINDVDSLITSSDKYQTSLLMKKNNIPFIDGIYVNATNATTLMNNFKDKSNYPLIIKSKKGSLGLGVYKIENFHELKNICEQIKLLDKQYEFLIQKYLVEGKDDYRVMVVGGEIKYIIQRHAKDGEIRSNLEQGSTFEFIPKNDEIINIVKDIQKVFDLQIMGIDLFKINNNFVVCEVNSNPGFRAYNTLKGKDFTKYFINYLNDY